MRHLKNRSPLCVVLVVVFALTVTSQPAMADTSGPDGAVMLLCVGSMVVSGANLIAITLYDGSVGLGITGVAMGSALAIYSSMAESVEGDEGVFVGIGVATAALGLIDLLTARSGKDDPELLGMRVSPSVRSVDGERSFGIQLTSRF